MSTSDKVLLTVLAVFAILVWLVPLAAGIYMEKQEQAKRGELDNSKAQYDERQKLIRLEASRHTLYVLGGYLLVWLVLEFVEVLHWESRTLTLLMGGLILAVVVWSGECILRGAMLGFNQGGNERSQIIMYLALGACWVLLGGADLESQADGARTATKLFLGFSYVILGSLMLYARHRRKLAESRLDTEDGGE